MFILLKLLLLALPLSCAASSVTDILAKTTSAVGGMEALEDIETLEFEFTGYRIWRHQSRRTEPPYDRVPVRSFVAIDFANEQVVRDGIGSYPGGLDFPSRTVIGPDGSFSLDTHQRTWSKNAMGGFDWIQNSARSLLPPLLVRAMNRQKSSLELVGRVDHGGTAYIHLELDGLGILVHPESHLVYATISTIHDMATQGEPERWRIYQDYRNADGINWPSILRDYLPGENTFTVDYRLTHLAVNKDISPHLVLPDDFVEGANTHMGYANDGALKPRPVGKGTWLAGDNNTNILYVEFEDYFVAMEMGGMAWYAEDVHEAMMPLMNGKPLRYMVPTHYHDDHAVGIRYYVKIGATILTTHEKTGWLRQLLATVDDGQWVDEARFEFIDGDQHVFRDRTNELRVLRYADAPHSANMLVGYLPRENAVFTADIFIGWGNTPEIRQGASHGVRHFRAWLDKSLGPDTAAAITNYLSVHGRPYSRDEFETMLSRKREYLVLPGNRTVNAEDWYKPYGLIDDSTSGRDRFTTDL